MKVIDKNAKYIVLYVTTDCNHQCKHCFLEHTSNWDPYDLIRISNILSKKCLVHINGAEPLLNLDYLKAYKAVNQSFIFTNGLVFLQKNVDEIIQQLRQNGINEIRLSHHFQATTSLEAVPEKIVEKITAFLIKNKFEVHYNTTVTSENYRKIIENCTRAHNLGVKRIKFFPLKKIGNAKKMSYDCGLSYEEMKNFYKELRKARAQYDINDLVIKVSGDLSGIAPNFTCNYGKNSYAITPDLKVYGCVYAISNLPPIGYMLKDGTIIVDDELIKHDCKHCLLKEH